MQTPLNINSGFLKSLNLIPQISLNLEDYGSGSLNKPEIRLLKPLIFGFLKVSPLVSPECEREKFKGLMRCEIKALCFVK